MKRPLRTLLMGAMVAGGLPAAPSLAQTYPAKPIRFVVPFAPGGGTDIIGRIVAQQLNEVLRQPVVVDNRAGAGSALGAEIVARSPPDGYTLLFGNISLAFNQALYTNLGYDTVRDFAPVTLTSVQPNIVVIFAGLAAQTVAEFAAIARANPGRLSYGSAGIGSGTHLSAELLAQSLNISLLHVPYRGTGPALTDLMGGQVQMMVSTFAPALPHVRAGRMRALGVTSAKRSAAAPDIPTLIEAGVPGYDYNTWYGLLLPARTPSAIVALLHAAALAALAREDAQRKLEAQGVETTTNTPAEFQAFLKAETRKWIEVVRGAGIPSQ